MHVLLLAKFATYMMKEVNKMSKKKQYKMRSISFIFAVVLFLVVNNMAYFIKDYIFDNVMAHISERSIGFDYFRVPEVKKKVVDFLENCDEVQGYSLFEERVGVTEHGEVLVVSEYMPDVIDEYCEEKNIQLEENECIMARYLEDEDGNFIDMSVYEGKEITISIERVTWRFLQGIEADENISDSYTFVVRGIYDSYASGETEKIYISHDKMEIINNCAEGYAEGDEKLFEYLCRMSTRECHLVVNDYANVENVYQELYQLLDEKVSVEAESEAGAEKVESQTVILKRNLGFESAREIMEVFIMIAYMISGVILAVLFVNYIYKTKEELKNRSIEIGILKAVGYDIWDIAKKIGQEYFSLLGWILFTSLTVGLLGWYGIAFGLKCMGDIFARVEFYPDINVFLNNYFVIIIACFVGFIWQMINVKKTNTVDILRSL